MCTLVMDEGRQKHFNILTDHRHQLKESKYDRHGQKHTPVLHSQ